MTDATSCHNTGTGNAMVTVKPLPATPSVPEGADSVDVYKVTSSVFITNGSEYATSYHWSLTPENAGSTESSEMTATVTWNHDFTGEALISVNGVNDCGEGEYSVAKVVTVYNSTGIEDLAQELGVWISPNPAGNSFRIEVTSRVEEIINIRLVNSQGASVFSMDRIPVMGAWKHNVDLKNIENGIYLLTVEHNNSRIIRKLVVLK